MSALQKNVASQVLTFCLVNATSGAALTGATCVGYVTGDGTQAGAAGTFTELGSGQYKYVPTQAETNVTSFGLLVTATGAIPVNLQCFTIGYNPTLANVPANVIQVNGTTQTARDLGANIDTTVSSRLATSGYTAPNNTGISAIETTLGTPAGASVSADIAAVNAKTTNLPASPAAVGSAMTLTSAYNFAMGTVAMTESYAANGAAPTPIQALFAMHQDRMSFLISGTSKTVYKLDNATTAYIITLNSSTSPTGVTRS